MQAQYDAEVRANLTTPIDPSLAGKAPSARSREAAVEAKRAQPVAGARARGARNEDPRALDPEHVAWESEFLARDEAAIARSARPPLSSRPPRVDVVEPPAGVALAPAPFRPEPSFGKAPGPRVGWKPSASPEPPAASLASVVLAVWLVVRSWLFAVVFKTRCAASINCHTFTPSPGAELHPNNNTTTTNPKLPPVSAVLSKDVLNTWFRSATNDQTLARKLLKRADLSVKQRARLEEVAKTNPQQPRPRQEPAASTNAARAQPQPKQTRPARQSTNAKDLLRLRLAHPQSYHKLWLALGMPRSLPAPRPIYRGLEPNARYAVVRGTAMFTGTITAGLGVWITAAPHARQNPVRIYGSAGLTTPWDWDIASFAKDASVATYASVDWNGHDPFEFVEDSTTVVDDQYNVLPSTAVGRPNFAQVLGCIIDVEVATAYNGSTKVMRICPGDNSSLIGASCEMHRFDSTDHTTGVVGMDPCMIGGMRSVRGNAATNSATPANFFGTHGVVDFVPGAAQRCYRMYSAVTGSWFFPGEIAAATAADGSYVSTQYNHFPRASPAAYLQNGGAYITATGADVNYSVRLHAVFAITLQSDDKTRGISALANNAFAQAARVVPNSYPQFEVPSSIVTSSLPEANAVHVAAARELGFELPEEAVSTRPSHPSFAHAAEAAGEAGLAGAGAMSLAKEAGYDVAAIARDAAKTVAADAKALASKALRGLGDAVPIFEDAVALV